RRRHRPRRTPDQHRAPARRPGGETGGGPACRQRQRGRPRPRPTPGRKGARGRAGNWGEPVMSQAETRTPTFADVYDQLKKIADNARTFTRLVTTDAKIAQTPKQVVWTLNKAKVYRYVPVVPEERRHKLPLLMVFAIMNRPHVLDL